MREKVVAYYHSRLGGVTSDFEVWKGRRSANAVSRKLDARSSEPALPRRYFVQSPRRLPLYFIVISVPPVFIFIQPS